MLTAAALAMLLAAGSEASAAVPEPPSAAATPLPGIGVMDFAAEAGISADLAAALSTVVTQEVERLELFRVTSAQATRVILGVERQRALLGCENCGNTNLTDLTTYDYVLTGRVSKAGGQLTLFLNLVPVTGGKGSNSTVSAPNDSKLMQEVPQAVLKLVGKQLQGKQGKVLVTSSEVGASVKIDDTLVGTTPLPAQTVAGGPHLVSVSKDGFTVSRKEVKVLVDQVVDAHFTLVPSPDTIAAYEGRTGRTRLLAWVGLGVAVAGVGGFAVSQLLADSAYGSVNDKTGSFLAYQTALSKGLQVDMGVDLRAKALEYRAYVQTAEAVGLACLGLAGLAAITSVVLFIIGEPPDKYEAFHAGLMLSPGTSGLAFSGTF